MKKKEYYELLEEYKQIISVRKFNLRFSDESKLYLVKKELLAQLEKTMGYLDLRKSMFRSKRVMYIEDLMKIDQKRTKCSILLGKIENEEYVEREIYENTYLRKYIWGYRFQ